MTTLILVAALFAATTPAQGAQSATRAAKPAARTAAAAPEISEGGYVKVGAKGVLAVVNGCEAKGEVLERAANRLSRSLMIDAKSVKGTWTLKTADADFKAAKATAAVFVVRDAALPISLIAMESRWGVVNAEGLDDACLVREILRVASVVIGGASSKYKTSLMAPVFSVDDLKKAGDGFTIDSIMLIFPNLPQYGFSQYRSMTYREACEEGIAPAPANDEQRKIADEFKK